MQTYELCLAVNEVGDYVTFKAWQNTVPCQCTAATGNYSPEWHRDNPQAANCQGRGIVGGALLWLSCYVIWQPVFLAGRRIRDFLDVTQVGELKEMDVIVVAAAGDGSFIPWLIYDCVETSFLTRIYRLLRVIPVPWGEMAIFRQVT